MADVQPEHGTAPIAYAMLAALSRDGKMRTPAQIIFWVLRNTYGRRTQGKGSSRRKTCAYTWTKIADQIGQAKNRSRVSRAGRDLIESGRLYLDAQGHIGIQKDWEKWAEGPGSIWHSDCATLTRVNPAQSPGQSGTPAGSIQHAYVGCAREVLTEQSYPLIGGPEKNVVVNVPTDTATARAALGDPAKPPHELPEFLRLSFKLQNDLMEQWRARQKPAPAAAAKKCRHCVSAAIDGALVCAEDAWCLDCDAAGRETCAPAAKLTPHPVNDGGMICPACRAARTSPEAVHVR